jgi:hypothetical protein
VVENWGPGDATLRLNGRDISRGRDFGIGHIRRINSCELVVWIKLEPGRAVDVELLPQF